MGLDMYAYSTDAWIPLTDFSLPPGAHEIARWRKHPNLHGWMEALYRQRHGQAVDFNCVTLQLLPADIDALEIALRQGALPCTHGFFFGESRPEDLALDLAFVQAAREAFAADRRVFYDSWW